MLLWTGQVWARHLEGTDGLSLLCGSTEYVGVGRRKSEVLLAQIKIELKSPQDFKMLSLKGDTHYFKST